jgi:glycosyltransferase involved in cell wall biosynthesis
MQSDSHKLSPPTSPLRIIALAPNDWDGPWMNRQHLLSRLARGHPIVYSTGLWESWQRKTAAYRNSPLFGRFDVRDGVSVDRPGRSPIRVRRLSVVDHFAIRVACRRWRLRLANSAGPLIAYVFHPKFLPYAQRLGADFIVYHAYDLFRVMGKGAAALEKPENELLELADLVIATSAVTAKDFSTRTNRKSHVVGNGVDCKPFAIDAPPKTPKELENIPRPRIGYVGAVNQKVDFELIQELSRRQPGWNFVLVGGVDNLLEGDRELLAEFRNSPNIHVIGDVAHHRIPEILFGLDVGLVCYRRFDWTLAGYPLKMLEYLACGLPVVASNLPAVREFANVLAIAESASEWEAAIRAALDGRGPGDPASRREIAKANSWDDRAAQVQALLLDMVARR